MNKIYIFIFLFGLSISAIGNAKKGILVEAESFLNHGGWKLDQQFMDQMGSPYLIAHGMGVPVPDATTIVSIPTDGEYYTYVRTYNWTSSWHRGEGPGKFSLTVDGILLCDNLGVTGNAWMWQIAGKIKLSKGNVELRLHDITGFEGRCDAIFLTTNPNAQPPAHNHVKVEKKAKLSATYDLVVIGGGIAGMSAAAAAERLGLRVALINDRPVLGGNNSSEVRVHLGGRIEMQPFPELGGLQKEFGPLHGGNAQPAENYEDQKKLDWMSKHKNVDLFLEYHAIAVKCAKGKIARVIIQHTRSGEQLQLCGKLFADCTGDGTLGYLAGAEYRMGRESRQEYDESLAPEQADSMTLGSSVQWYSEEGDEVSEFPKFEYGLKVNSSNVEKVMMGEWTWETGMNRNQITEFERIRDYGMLVVYSNWSYLKNNNELREKYAKRKLGWVAYVAGKRESRRLLGDHVLTQGDIDGRVQYPDASFVTSWSIDLHRPDPINAERFPDDPFKAVTTHVLAYPYAVPYRCLYSRNISNLFMAGRCISQSHVALGTTRVMRTTGMMGEVVGMAASVCKKHNVLPRAVYENYLHELISLMKQGVNEKGLLNNQKYNEGSHL